MIVWTMKMWNITTGMKAAMSRAKATVRRLNWSEKSSRQRKLGRKNIPRGYYFLHLRNNISRRQSTTKVKENILFFKALQPESRNAERSSWCFHSSKALPLGTRWRKLWELEEKNALILFWCSDLMRMAIIPATKKYKKGKKFSITQAFTNGGKCYPYTLSSTRGW